MRLALILALFTACSACGPTPARDSRPSIVLILLDDMGYSDLGPYGSEIPTPNIDSLAAAGLRFTHFYNTPKCFTTRAELLTGLHWPRALENKGLSEHSVTIAEALKQSGYATFMSGKWHLNVGQWEEPTLHPLARGFDNFFGTMIGGSYYDPLGLERGGEPVEPPDGFYYTDAIVEEAALRIEDAARLGIPFFQYVAFTAPHWPMQAPAETVAGHENVYTIGWDEIRQARYRRQLELGVVKPGWGLSARDAAVPAWQEAPDKAWQARRMAVYAAMVEHIDRGVGRIVDALERAHMLDNTLIMLLSDNGASHEQIGTQLGVFTVGGSDRTRDGHRIQFGRHPEIMPGPETTYQAYGREWANVSNTPFRLYKSWSHEGGISTPLIVHWPAKITAGGAITSAIGHVIDILPTFLEASGAEYPESIRGRETPPLDGVSLLPVFEGGDLETRPLFWKFGGGAATRQGRWKIVAGWAAERHWELYDMEADRGELNDLSGEFPDKVRELSNLFEAWVSRAGAGPG